MKAFCLKIGQAVFWLLWPVWWLYLRKGKRTRLLLICGDEFLVLKGWLGTGEWGLPGGGLHKYEDPAAGVLRELREETGVLLSESDINFEYETTESRYGLSFTYHCFSVVMKQKPAIHLQRHEIAAYVWLPLKNPALSLSTDASRAVVWWLNKG